ncbi:MAG: alpha/beta hydrolase [Erysipelotrichaceae bacterium]|nr:alpha/beta hydrolase [Erysipelotrichaceae bacterium]
MEHTEYVHEIENSQTIVVFIHGILGTPHHFDELIPCVPKDYSIYNMLLDGHGKTVDDFAKATMSQWKQQVHQLLLKLKERYDNIFVVAHSMGTLFAIQEAIDLPQVKRIFLLAVPLNIFVRPKMLVMLFRIMTHQIKEDDVQTLAAMQCNSITLDQCLWKYLKWIPNYWALLKECHRTKRMMDQLSVPCFVFQSKQDELVAKSSVRYLQSEYIHWEWLSKSGHFFYDPEEFEYLKKRFQNFMK